MRRQKLGEVESEYTAEKLIFSAIFVPKNFHNRSKFDKVLTKNKFAQFFETRCIGARSSHCFHTLEDIGASASRRLFTFVVWSTSLLAHSIGICIAFMSKIDLLV